MNTIVDKKIKKLVGNIFADESKAQFRLVFENSKDAILWADANTGIIIRCNRASLEMFERSENELVGQPQTILHPSYNKEKISESFRTNVSKGGIKNMEAEIITKSGKIRFVEISASVIKLGEKQIIQGIFTDITEHKKTEEALRESEKMYSELVDLLPQTVFETDLNGKFTYGNKIGFDQFGYSQEDFQSGLNVFGMIIPEERDSAARKMKTLLKEKCTAKNEYTALRKDGSTFPVVICLSVLVRNNQPVGLRGIVFDITELKQAEQELKESEEKFRAFVNNVGEGFGFVNPDEEFVYANPAAEKIFGVGKDNLVGRNLKEFLSEEQFMAVIDQTKIRKEGQSSNYEIEITRADGKIRSIDITAVPQFDVDKNFIGTYGIFRDITDRRQIELKIQQQNQELIKLNSDKDRFLSILAHDLKSPFNPILGFLGILTKNIRKYEIDKIENQLNNINLSAQRVYNLLE